MSNVRLTNESDYLLTVLYREYLNRRKLSMSKDLARMFDKGSIEIHQNLVPNWSFDDVDETCKELSRAGMLECFFADDITNTCSLTDDAIILSENKFADGLDSILSYIERLRNLLPF